MNTITKEIVLDVARENNIHTIIAKQNDFNTRFLRVQLTNEGTPISVKADAIATINAAKKIGQAKSFKGTVNSDGTVTVPITGWMLDKAGTLRCDISVIDVDTEQKLTSMPFEIYVDKASVSDREISKDEDYSLLINLFKDCESAIENAERVNISAEQTATGADITVTNRDGEETTVHVDTLFAANSWAGRQSAVRLGLGPKLFPVGHEFTVHNSDYNYDMIWRVVAHDHHKSANKHLEHTMTLEMKNVLSNSSGTYVGVQFDAPEALYYVKDGLSAGTYSFSWTYAAGSVAAGTYQFAIAQNVPAGGQIVLVTNGSSNPITACKISTYASVGATVPIESDIGVTNGTGGTSLGTVSGDSSTNENLNCGQRVLFGSNNYAQSAVEQWLNSPYAAGSVWTPKTVFDRPPAWANTLNGFIHSLPSDFMKAVQPAVIPCRTNPVFEVDSLDGAEFDTNQFYELTSVFFLLSRPEVFGAYDSSGMIDGELLEYYDGLTAEERIHRDMAGTARNMYLRSYFTNALGFRNIDTSGSMGTGNALNTTHGVAAACIIG